MVVAGAEGFVKNAYRKYAIRGPITPGDDFAMMREVLERRFGRAMKEQQEADAKAAAKSWPDLRADRRRRRAALGGAIRALPISACRTSSSSPSPRGRTAMPGANGSTPRDATRSSCRRATPCSITCSACATRRTASPSRPIAPAARSALVTSELDEIAGVGSARKRALLNHFGSARGVKKAGLADLEAAPGINRETARRVYAHFHPDARLESTG